ncbi:MAG TPA: hypothetical protein VK813_08295 [Edaphobacter sp.]|jgi:hypothetical protein|nr:hypothetical protein [Edaphobacter sp.]
MLKAVTWCVKCLFLYFLVVVAAIRYSWVFTTPVWGLANKMHWTQLNRVAFVLSYFLPIFAVAGFLLGLVPFGKLGKALEDLFRSFFPSASSKLPTDPDAIPPILWAWLPVTLAFLTRFITWQSRNSSVFDAHRSPGRVERFFGPLYAQSSGLLDDKWITDRFLFTGPMLFLMACAIAALVRYRLTALRSTQGDIEPDKGSV